MHISRKEQAEASRAGLVAAGRACFAEKGFEATTVASVLDRAGMARGALYHYFPGGKLDLFTAVFDSVNEAFHIQRDALLEANSPLAKVCAGIRLFLELCTEDEFARIALMDAPRLIPGQDGRGSTYELLRSQLEEAAVAGEIPGLDAEVVAVALYGAVRSVGELVAASHNRTEAVADAARTLDRIVEALWSSIRR